MATPCTPPGRLPALALAALIVFACSGPEDRLANHIEEANRYAERGLYREAVLEYRSALEIDPNRGDVHFGLAEAYRALGNERRAFWELQESVRLDPGNVTALVYYAQTLALSSEDDVRRRGLEVARLATTAAPGDVRAWLAEGRALIGLQRLGEAVASFERAVSLDPEDGEALRTLANAYALRGDHDQAERTYRRGTQVAPDFLAWVSLAQYLANRPGRLDESIATYREAIAAADADDAIRGVDALAALLVAHGRSDDAEELLREAYEDQGAPAALLRSLARFYRLTGQHDRAESFVRQAAISNPDQLAPQVTLAAYLADKGDFAGAEEALAAALAVDPSDPDARLRQAYVILERARREGDAEATARGDRLLAALIESQPPNRAQALVVRGRLELLAGDTAAAAETLRSAIDLGADSAEAHTLLAAALSPTRPRLARTELHRAIERDPASLEARTLLAEVHNRLGEPELAIRTAGAAFDRAPERTDLRITLARSLSALGRLDEAARLLDGVPDEDVDARVLHLRAGVARSRGDAAGARRWLLEADRIQPYDPDTLEALLVLDGQEDRLDDSAARIAAAARVRPDDGRLARLEGRVAARRGEIDEARRQLQRAIELEPDHLPAYTDLAQLYTSRGRLGEAVEAYEAAASKQPSAALDLLLGILYEQGGLSEKARARYESALELDGALALAQNNLAFLLAEQGEDLERALELAQEAKRALPNEPGVADTLGWVLYKRGSFDAAAAYLLESWSGYDLAASPEKGVVAHHLAQALVAAGKPQQAAETLRQTLAELARLRAAGGGGRPGWEDDLRAMLAEIDSA